MEIALNSDTPGGFKHENAIASQNGLALLASITLKNALNINNNNSSTKNNINNKNNNYLLNQNNIIYHEATQPQHDFISSPKIVSSSSLPLSAVTANNSLPVQSPVGTVNNSLPMPSPSTCSSTVMQPINLTEQKNVFAFTTAGLQALTATALSTIEKETRARSTSVDQQQQGETDVALSNKTKKNHHNSLSTNHHQTNNNKTLSAKDPTVALLEALSIKTKKKQPIVSTQQQQTPSSSSAVTTTTHSFVGTNGNSSASNNTIGNGNNNKNSYRIPSDILDDLASRFIINVPDMELSNLIRICFQIELAHWFYLDFFCASDEEKKLQPCGIKQFALQIFEHIPFLRQHLSSIDKILEDWKNYKLSVPTYGAILISEDLNYCLLVQSYFAKSSWGFPKGKVNENEDPVHCATREVYEETGYDITELIVPNDYIEAVINYQYTRLYIVRDVSLETKFSPRTRNEIKCCDWFPIDSLPVSKNDAISKPKLGINANSFFMIIPFVKRLKKWVNDKRNGVETRHKYSSGGSPSSTSPLAPAVTVNGQQTKSSCKKQHKRINSNNFNDEINALYNVGGSVAAGAAALFNANSNCSNSNSNRSKRQRHKSMGDLDVMKLNNTNNYNNSSNGKTANNNNKNCGSITSSGTSTANSGGNISCNNNNSNQKRNSKIIAAGNSASNINNGCNSNNNNGNSSSKRQLFHSQSQTNNLQQNGEKIVSSFDLIRKEKQQMKAALAKAQNLQQNLNSNNGRQRAKSQSDKVSLQQQQQNQHQNSSVNNSCNKQQQRLQKQQSLNTTNTNMQNYNISSSNNHHNNKNFNNNNNNFIKFDVNHSLNQKLTIGGLKTPTPPPVNGKDLLALAAAAAAVTPVVHKTAPPQLSKLGICAQQQQQQQKSRPSSVSLHFPEALSNNNESSLTGNEMPKLERMASGTNLRLLKRSTSQQSSSQQQPPPPQRQASALQFTPTFSSWTNFTFTKNFIANVFC